MNSKLLIFVLHCLTLSCARNPNGFSNSLRSNQDVISRGQIVTAERSIRDGPPPHEQYAKMARYLVHTMDWTALGTNSQKIPGFPMVNVISIADSTRGGESTGNIYFYLTNLDFTGQDIEKDPRATLLFSQEQDLTCSSTHVDPMEPTCSRVIITGRIRTLSNSTQEYTFGQEAMLSRHPAASNWLKAHSFYLCKLDIEQIIVLDFYGGPHYVSLEDYFNAYSDDRSAHGGREVVIKINKDSKVEVIHIEV